MVLIDRWAILHVHRFKLKPLFVWNYELSQCQGMEVDNGPSIDRGAVMHVYISIWNPDIRYIKNYSMCQTMEVHYDLSIEK